MLRIPTRCLAHSGTDPWPCPSPPSFFELRIPCHTSMGRSPYLPLVQTCSGPVAAVAADESC
ncbi:hypothetical protein CGRA01v4_14584 [Colletotrichum graminicola]|nr:hypothetical protein CGRA01v4_14584 [Colletotrichum graminicola]